MVFRGVSPDGSPSLSGAPPPPPPTPVLKLRDRAAVAASRFSGAVVALEDLVGDAATNVPRVEIAVRSMRAAEPMIGVMIQLGKRLPCPLIP
mmetsp:Transcript_37611/g.112718  ORF Transcript_37611/g.112718 Transcript_37611/m.112718 type:complete len:92 (+) Transcript_37611:897-1172(+)